MKPIEHISEYYPELLVFDDLDDCILGIAWVFGSPVVAYDYDAVIESLCDNLDVTTEDAIDYYNFNIAGAYIGPTTPAFIERLQSFE